ncbi:hypothetical protein BAE44_0000790 [Dichanthelium oligosanthes]|uniref:KIB1-4 beta-propeller domain-containing protein n=1 Tax=Dichanthelium oligosanthes TaxID=888268 RepID=A0A1E5WL92_9POAL|nr:hypothetical protein BAE44_0000790 [Dichanthelium oligosanthes]
MAMATEAMAQGWSSLPADLVNRVADCLLATNDLDYYMDLRAVCHCWRSATADPRTTLDACFRPTRWIALDEISQSNSRLFVNATTGRFLRRSLPLLHDYHLVTSTIGHHRFMAPTPSEVFFVADPDSECFDVNTSHTVPAITFDIPSSIGLGPSPLSSDSELTLQSLLVLRGLAVELSGPGEMLRVDRSPQQGVYVFRMDSLGSAMERVTSIGSQALFLGANRCISIHADSFPSINANCIYYKKEEDAWEQPHLHVWSCS